MRCYKCNGCVGGFDEYKPLWCNNEKCPQGDENPDKRTGIQILQDAMDENNQEIRSLINNWQPPITKE